MKLSLFYSSYHNILNLQTIFIRNKRENKMIRLLLLVIFVTKSNTLPTNQTEACNNYQQNNKFLWTEILEFNETTYKIYYFLKFKKFTDLLLECNKTYNTFNLNEVKFVPAQRMLLNNDEFRLEKLFKIDTTKKSYFENKFIFRKFDGLILLRLVTGLGLTWGLNVLLVKRCLFKSI